MSSYTSNGGGATHIAKRTGQLKDLSSYTSDILMVSGGGGGGLIVGETAYTGKEAGGISGSGDNSADQSTGNAFGLGESGTNLSGGGSGLYGGYKGTSSKSGGAGSGYIGNSLLSNKKMVGYNVPTSSATGTKTESVEVYDSNYVANKPKSGNGHARIKLVEELPSELVLYNNGVYNEKYFNPNSLNISVGYLRGEPQEPTVTFGDSEITITNDCVSGSTRNYFVDIGVVPSVYHKFKIEYEFSIQTTGGWTGGGISINRNAEIQYYFKGGIYNYHPYDLSEWSEPMIGDNKSSTAYNISDSETGTRTMEMQGSQLTYMRFYLALTNTTQATFKIKKLSLLME